MPLDRTSLELMGCLDEEEEDDDDDFAAVFSSAF
jgi:hypothetical protein